MDSLYFDLIKTAYHLALAVLIGGSLALGGAAAPAIFERVRDRAEAGAVFGGALARFDGLAIVAVFVAVIATILRALSFETVEPKIVGRWIALALIAAAVLYASAWANPVARSIRAQTPGFDDLPAEAAARREFEALHRRSRRAMSATVLLGIVALFLS
ncbi:MAG: DUF4149 domain-containing protein [Candidatus Limnocylindria bacterium]